MTAKPVVVVVTGASTGIGAACVGTLVAAGFFVFGSVRREEDAARLQALHGENFAPLLFDVVDGEAVAAAAEQVEKALAGRTLAGLVNNAGAALPGPLLYQPIDEVKRQIEINLIGQLRVTQAFAPLLGAGQARQGAPGRIVNMSSVSGKIAYPFLGAYAASKHGLEALSDALRVELTMFGVDVVVVEPGVIRTPIWGKTLHSGLERYGTTVYGPAAQRMLKWALEHEQSGPPAELVGKAVLRALVEKRPPARIPVVANYLSGWLLPRLLPTRFFDWLVARSMGFLAPTRAQGG